MCVNSPAIWLGGDGEEKFHLVYRYRSGATQLDYGECPGYLLLAKKRLALGGRWSHVNIHLGVKSYREDQKQLTEVVICCVKGEKQHVAASTLWFTVHVKQSDWSLKKFVPVNVAFWSSGPITGVFVICLFI